MNLEKSELKKKFGKNIIFDENLSKYSWFNLGGPAKILFKPESIDQLVDFLKHIKNSLKIICLGAGSNTLIRDEGFNGVVIKLSPKFSYIKQLKNNILEVGAGTLDKTLSKYAAENSITNFEVINIDAEGAEYEILKTIDFNKYRPSVVIVEIKCENINEALNSNITKLLFNEGYELHAVAVLSYFFVRKFK